MLADESWLNYRRNLYTNEGLGFSLDISKMGFSDSDLNSVEPLFQKAYSDMLLLEKGDISNVDEKRMVGHYWLRSPEHSPSLEIRYAIEENIKRIQSFASDIHDGRILTQTSEIFTDLLVIGIGGSALGPQFLARALSDSSSPLRIHFLDNTDPDGIDYILKLLGANLQRTLTIVVSKSGGTPETRNGMIEILTAYRNVGLSFYHHAVAITSNGSDLYHLAVMQSWLAIFPMWDWVGGRTSVTSSVGLLPAALLGVDIVSFLDGARSMDVQTREASFLHNPAALLASMWYLSGDGFGKRDMVILPYKDQLELFGRYLQQLVMESIGKTYDLNGKIVNQGLVVYGNKGSTDQHAYIQQLREGPDNFFATFIHVQKNNRNNRLELSPHITSGDYLYGFLLGTRTALFQAHKKSMTILLEELNARTLGALIALYERAVGFYAFYIGVNAYNQPGVEAGKKAAESILELHRNLIIRLQKGRQGTAEEFANAMNTSVENVYLILEYLVSNKTILKTETLSKFDSVYYHKG